MKEKNSLTTLLIVLISGLFIVQQYFYQSLFADFALVGSGYVEHTQYYRLLSVALMHGGWMHLAFNMLALHQLGNVVEHFFGRPRYIFILLASLLSGSLLSYTLMSPLGVAVGASGMIFGLFGSLLVVGKRIGLNYQAVMGTLVINAILPFIDHNIDWHAHVGGFIGGAIATKLVVLAKRS